MPFSLKDIMGWKTLWYFYGLLWHLRGDLTHFKKEWEKIYSNKVSRALYGKIFHSYCSKRTTSVLEQVFKAAKNYYQLLGYELTILAVKIICYERTVSKDLPNMDRKGSLAEHREIHMQMAPPPPQPPPVWAEMEEVWSQMSQEMFQIITQVNTLWSIKGKKTQYKENLKWRNIGTRVWVFWKSEEILKFYIRQE